MIWILKLVLGHVKTLNNSYVKVICTIFEINSFNKDINTWLGGVLNILMWYNLTVHIYCKCDDCRLGHLQLFQVQSLDEWNSFHETRRYVSRRFCLDRWRRYWKMKVRYSKIFPILDSFLITLLYQWCG